MPQVIEREEGARPAQRRLFPPRGWLVAAIMLAILADRPAKGAEQATLAMVKPRQRGEITSIKFVFDRTPAYDLTRLPAGHTRLTFHDTDASTFRKLRGYRDRNIAGINVHRRGSETQVEVLLQDPGTGLRLTGDLGTRVVSLDVGAPFKRPAMPVLAPGRELIMSGAGRLVAEFDPPAQTEFPFSPTSPQLLKQTVPGADLNLFRMGEALLYRGRAGEAEEVFQQFLQRDQPFRALVAYRLGESRYLQKKYREAVEVFREGESAWPGYPALNPSIAYYFADSLARQGDIVAARRLLGRTVAEIAERPQGPLLTVRLADILSRQGREKEAEAIYRTIASGFKGKREGSHAVMKLADQRLFLVGPDSYHPLADEYAGIVRTAGDQFMRERALFKQALVEAMYGPAAVAVPLVAEYEKRFPRGMFVTVAHSMREELLLLLYRERAAVGDLPGIITLAIDNRAYLARCFSDDTFAPRLVEAFTASGDRRKELDLFSFLLEREWAASAAPLLALRLVEDSLASADTARAEWAGRLFVERYPAHEVAFHISERLADIAFRKGELRDVASLLAWLQAGNRPARQPVSLYYLGKALAAMGDQQGATRAMTRYIASIREGGGTSPVLTDAYFTAATASLKAGDRAGAMGICRSGLAQAPTERRDQFLYRLGEIAEAAGGHDEARQNWQRIVQEGRDPEWRKMAEQSLALLEWREQVAVMRRQVSK